MFIPIRIYSPGKKIKLLEFNIKVLFTSLSVEYGFKKRTFTG